MLHSRAAGRRHSIIDGITFVIIGFKLIPLWLLQLLRVFLSDSAVSASLYNDRIRSSFQKSVVTNQVFFWSHRGFSPFLKTGESSSRLTAFGFLTLEVFDCTSISFEDSDKIFQRFADTNGEETKLKCDQLNWSLKFSAWRSSLWCCAFLLPMDLQPESRWPSMSRVSLNSLVLPLEVDTNFFLRLS